jgi:hypothetical protein
MIVVFLLGQRHFIRGLAEGVGKQRAHVCQLGLPGLPGVTERKRV